MPETNKVLLMSTGGTIAGQVAKGKTTVDDAKGPEYFAELLRPTLSSLTKKWGVDVKPIQRVVCEVDSSNIQPEIWVQLANTIKAEYDNYESFIITHGTNTLGYTCAALTFALPNLNKPVVLTGSQVPSGEPGSDALTNLNNALRVAVRPYDPRVKGVVAVFGSQIITGTRVKKDTEFDYDAFKSFGAASLGRIGRIINIDKANLYKHLSYLGVGDDKKTNNTPALTAQTLICDPRFDMRIASLTEFPGMSADIFENLVNYNDIQGFILRSFGAGDPNVWKDQHADPEKEPFKILPDKGLGKAFVYLKAAKVPIVVTTQAPNGNSNFQVNEPGQCLRQNADRASEMLAIPSYDMSVESQTTKLAWLLSKKTGKWTNENGEMVDRKKEIDYTRLCDLMVEDMHGEVNRITELS